MRKVYLFVYSDSVGGREVIKAWANKEPAVLHWRTEIPHTFYIISEASASELASSFVAFNGRKARFLIAEVGENRQGLLPANTWFLFKNKRRKGVTSKPNAPANR